MKKYIFLLLILLTMNVKATNTSTIVMDVDSGRILYQNNAYEKKLIASTTKIMTFVVAYEYANEFLNLEIEAGNEILKMYGTSIYIRLHEKMKLIDLLYGLMMRSGNDAAEVIANFVGGSEEGFVKLMNLKAKNIGMNNTTFSNPHGLDEYTKNYSTAYDMALLSCYANKIPLYQKITGTKYHDVQTEIKAYSWINRNKMLFTYPYFKTGKTGYTPSAGKTFVSSAEKNNLHLTIVSLNDPNTYENHRLLYEEMFKKYLKYEVVNANTFFIENMDNTYIKNSYYYPLKENEIDKLKYKVILDSKENDIVGNLIVELDNKEIYREKIYKKNLNTNKVSLWEKVKTFFQKLL